MGLQIQFDVSNQILLVRLEGRLTDEAAIECYEAVEAYAMTKNISAGIVDLRAVTDLPVSAHLVRKWQRRRPKIPGDLLRIIVAPNIVAYGLLRMFQLVSDLNRPNFHVVRSVEQALTCSWLVSTVPRKLCRLHPSIRAKSDQGQLVRCVILYSKVLEASKNLMALS
jgi:hypothetical protein